MFEPGSLAVQDEKAALSSCLNARLQESQNVANRSADELSVGEKNFAAALKARLVKESKQRPKVGCHGHLYNVGFGYGDVLVWAAALVWRHKASCSGRQSSASTSQAVLVTHPVAACRSPCRRQTEHWCHHWPLELSPCPVPTLTGLSPAMQRPRQLQTEDLGEPSGAAAASAMDVDELEDDDEDAAAQRMPPPGRRGRGSQGAPASRGALPCLGLGLSLWLVLRLQRGRQAAMAGSSTLPGWVHQPGIGVAAPQAALAGSVAPFRCSSGVHSAGIRFLLNLSAWLAHWQSCGRAPTLSQQPARCMDTPSAEVPLIVHAISRGLMPADLVYNAGLQQPAWLPAYLRQTILQCWGVSAAGPHICSVLQPSESCSCAAAGLDKLSSGSPAKRIRNAGASLLLGHTSAATCSLSPHAHVLQRDFDELSSRAPSRGAPCLQVVAGAGAAGGRPRWTPSAAKGPAQPPPALEMTTTTTVWPHRRCSSEQWMACSLCRGLAEVGPGMLLCSMRIGSRQLGW